jgi:hypothetical protein
VSGCPEVNQSRFGKPTLNGRPIVLKFAKQMARKLAISPVESAVFLSGRCGILATVWHKDVIAVFMRLVRRRDFGLNR